MHLLDVLFTATLTACTAVLASEKVMSNPDVTAIAGSILSNILAMIVGIAISFVAILIAIGLIIKSIFNTRGERKNILSSQLAWFF